MEEKALLAEVRRATTNGGPAAHLRGPSRRRARRRLAIVLLELADHLNRSIVTRAYCRYRDDAAVAS